VTEPEDVTLYTTAYNWSTSWARWIQPTSHRRICIKSIVTLSSHLRLDLPRGLLQFTTKIVYTFRLSCVLHAQPNSLIWSFCNVSWRVKKLRSTSQCNTITPPVTSSPIGPKSLLSSNQCYLKVRQTSFTAIQNYVQVNLIFMLIYIYIRQEDGRRC
jgi:hypothetical protein